MLRCKHVRVVIERRKDPQRYGQTVLARCSCGKFSSNWKCAEWKARVALRQEIEDTYRG